MWKSKLGNEFPKEEMKRNEKKYQAELNRLRNLPANRCCADCGALGGNVWASVNLGVFCCLTCGSHHRGLGTHISIPKGCTGTYLWGPDELERMKSMGNAKAKVTYGDYKPCKNATAIEWRQFLIDKYQNHKFAPKTTRTAVATEQQGTANSHKETTTLMDVRVDSKGSSTGAIRETNDLISFEDTEETGTPSNTALKKDDFFGTFGL